MQGLSKLPRRGTSPVESPRRRDRRAGVTCRGLALDNLPLASEHRCARCPGVPAFQKGVVPTCVGTERSTDNSRQPLLREGIYARGAIPVDDFSWVISGCHQAEEPCPRTVSSDLERAPVGKTGKAGGLRLQE